MLDAYLASAGLRVRDHAVTEGTLTLEPEKDGAAIILSYSYGERKAVMLYPSGTRLEKEAHSSGNGSILPELRYQFGIAIPDLSAQVIPLTVMNTGFTFTYDQAGSWAVMDYPAGAQLEPVFAASAAVTPTPRPKAVPTATPKPMEPPKNHSAMECQSRAILDFVPVHFAVDAYGLRRYDGTALYEYPHKDVGESEWGSINLNHSRGEVASFLQSAANCRLKEYHFDGLRMDAVSRLIYWQGDEKRGENGMTVNFLKVMNRGLHRLHPTVILIAEDSTAYPGVTHDVEDGGLGFDYKWDLGWMHDTLKYLASHPYDRAAVPDRITFSIFWYILPFSHDEVVHGKKTIIDKLYGTYEQKFTQARLLYLYMMTHPGKKLNFMGNGIAMFREWNETREPHWDLLKMPLHDAFLHFMTELNDCYGKEPALWALEGTYDGFKGLESVSDNPCVCAYTRTDGETVDLILLNFSDCEADLVLDDRNKYVPLLSTGWEEFGGQEKKTTSEISFKSLAPFSGVLLKRMETE